MNLDVLCEIMAFVILMPRTSHPRSTIASMMRANRTLYHEGAKVLLSGEVELYVESRLPSFVKCCLAEDGIRTSYLRGLTLGPIWEVPASFPDLVVKFSNLASLSLELAERSFRGSNGEAFLRAVASLTSLSRLKLTDIYDLSERLLHTLRAPLRELALSDHMGRHTRMSFSVLSHCAPTLETLHLSTIDLWYESRNLEPRFPNLSHLLLDIWKCEAESFDLADLLAALPNLKTLTANTPSSQGFCIHERRDYVFDFARAHNRKVATRADRSPWASLTEVRTDLGTAWAFGLSCKVDYLALDVFHERDPSEYLGDVLADTRPSTLYLKMDPISFTGFLHTRVGLGPKVRDGLAKAVRNHPPELQTVCVGVYLTFDHADAEVKNVLQGLAGLEVESFRLIIFGRVRSAYKEPETGLDETEMLAGLDPQAIVQMMLDVIPSIHRAALEVNGLPDYSAHRSLGSDN